MEIDKYIHNGTLTIRVVPNASKNDVVEEHNQLKVYIKAVPDKNKANVELIKFFKKKFGLRVMIKSGMKGRDKVLKVIK
ncbi:YggU family protein [Candidatus Woesearchaeota archaeon]|nr:YggU family protein [Candidatus Woesearchaeota archaeon]MBT5396906.1 YggU family protein [Candidatus Woesearchaeota archaeon]MBT6367099.1 YggU family protein [Candidatus Woesearchaeota archaeon]MBT7762327.1 YggU family protein [Candidatus Woesearchaeota archaeon]